MPQRPPEKPSNPRADATSSPPQSNRLLWIVGGTVASISILLAAAAWAFLSGSSETPRPVEVHPTEARTETPQPAAVDDKTDTLDKLDKKSQPNKPNKKKQAQAAAKNTKPAKSTNEAPPLWESPTNGRPLNLGYLSPGAQIIAVLRPAA